MLIEFFGAECPHCKTMAPMVEKLKKEEQVQVEQLEVWHNEANLQKMQTLDNGKCGGVPFFINTENGATICGAASYEELKKWATGK